MRKLVIDAQTLTSGGTYTSAAIDVRNGGVFGIDWVVLATQLTLTYQMCGTKDGTYFTPDGGGAISTCTGRTAYQGASFAPEYFPYMKVVVLNNGADTATISAFLDVQERRTV